MNKILFLILFLPLSLQAQDRNQPYVKFDHGAILFYLPSGSAYAPSLPVYKPGFVHILRTPGFQTQSNQELSDHLASGIMSSLKLRHASQDLEISPMNNEDKTEFLENYACLILLNYTGVSELDTVFYTTAVALQEDINSGIKTNSALVVKMFDMNREKQ